MTFFFIYFFFFYFSEKTSLDISCESSAWQTIDMKCQDMFSLKKKKKKKKTKTNKQKKNQADDSHEMSRLVFSKKKKKKKNRMSSATNLLGALRVKRMHLSRSFQTYSGKSVGVY